MDGGSANRLALYPAQAEGVARYISASEGRMLLAYGTGCGKTATAISCIKTRWEHSEERDRSPRVLVVCPAMVRRHWVREFRRWAAWDAWPIEMGRFTKGGTKAQKELRDRAYQASIQVCSYDLLGQVAAMDWQYIVFDEIHHLGTPTSKQSRRAECVVQASKGARILGLSATLIPTTLWQIWNPLRLLFGTTEWGKPSRTGGVSWKFAERYCGITENEYGCAIGPGIPDRLPELSERIGRVAHQIQRADISADMPPLSVTLLEQPGTALSRPAKIKNKWSEDPTVVAAIEWCEQLPSDVQFSVILVYHRDRARAIHAGLNSRLQAGPCLYYIDGSTSTAERDQRLRALEANGKGVLVATSESLREGIRMMWAQKVLFAEWRQSPAQVIQVLGRFQSVGDKRKPMVEILVDDNLTSEAHQLIQRVEVLNDVLRTGEVEHKVSDLFTPKAFTEEKHAACFLDLFTDAETATNRSAFDKDDPEEDDDD